MTVIARIKAKVGKEEDLRSELLILVSASRLESGCKGYDLYESEEEPGLFFTQETWTGPESHAAHFGTPQVKRILSKVPELLAEPLQVHELRMISPLAKK